MLWKNPSSRPHQWFFIISVYLAALTILFASNWANYFTGVDFAVLLTVSWALLPAMLFRFHAVIASVPAGTKMPNAVTAGFLLAGLLLLALLLITRILLAEGAEPHTATASLLHPLFVSLVITSIAAAIFQFRQWCRKIPGQQEKKRFVVILYLLAAFYFLTWFLYVMNPDSQLLGFLLMPPVYLLPWYLAVTFGFLRKISSSPGNLPYSGNDLFRDLQQIVFICNKERIVVQTNKFSVDLLGLEMDEVVGSNVVELFSGHYQIVEQINSAYKKGHSEAREMFLLTVGNEEIPVSVSCILLADRFNDHFGFAVYGQDYREVISLRNEIKKRKQAEASLQKLSKNLEQEAEERTAEIRRSVEQLNLIVASRQRDEETLKQEIGEMEVMLNEIYTRVTKNIGIILNILESARELKFAVINDFEKQRLNRLFQRIDAILLVNKQLMTEQHYGMVDFKQFLEMLLKRYNDRADDGPGPEMVLKASADLLWIDQAVPLALVASELVSNAVTYAFEKRTTSKPKVWIEYAHLDDTWCHFLVKDNGSGVVPDARDQQYDLTGFSLAEMLVMDQLNGSFQITSEEGLSVLIRIPLNELRQGHIGVNR